MQALITGATGFVGRRLVERLARPKVVSRDPRRARSALGDVQAFAWEGERAPFPAEALEGVEVVFSLAGEPIADGRWTEAKKARIRDSRVLGTRALVDAIAARSDRPRVLVSASAVGFYGDRGDAVLDEREPPGNDFLSKTCVEWEAEARRAAELGLRVVCLRTGLVMGPRGGVIGKLLPMFRWGLGGRLGDGRQWMSWIHLDDQVELYLFAAQNEKVSGALNSTAPNPVTNEEFTKALGQAVHRPTLFPAPAFGLRIALGEMADALLGSQRAIPRAAQDAGFSFRFPELRPALEQIVGER